MYLFWLMCVVRRTTVPAALLILFFSVNAMGAVGFIDQLNAELKRRFEQEMFNGGLSCQGELICGASLIPGFYLDRNFNALWINAEGITDEATVLFSTLKAASNDGLQSQDYHFPGIQELMQQLKAPREQ